MYINSNIKEIKVYFKRLRRKNTSKFQRNNGLTQLVFANNLLNLENKNNIYIAQTKQRQVQNQNMNLYG